MLYRIAFPAGFRPLVERLLRRDFGPDCVSGGDESTAVFAAGTLPAEPPYAQGLAAVLDTGRGDGLEAAYRRFAKRLDVAALRGAAASGLFGAGRGARRFALRALDNGQPSPVDAGARAALETAIGRALGLEPDSARPDLQFQVAARSGGEVHFLLQSKKPAPVDRAAGALPAATARLLIELGRPEAGDAFLDPFMGSGAIVLERARLPYRLIFGGDADPEAVAALKLALKAPRMEKKRRTIFPKVLDARKLDGFEAGFLDAVVTDPPWGVYEKLDEAERLSLYSGFLAEAARAMKPSGRLVLLLGRDAAVDAAMAATAWSAAEDYPVLISGRKARALRLSLAGGDQRRR